MKKNYKIILFVLIGLFLIDIALNYGPVSQREKINNYLNESIALAATVYTISSIANGIVSVVKESSIAVEPMGFGAEIAVGQILDPVDKAFETISGIAANSLIITSLQRIVFGIITEKISIYFIIIGLIILIGFAIFPEYEISKTSVKFLTMIILIRLSVPVMCGIGIWTEENFINNEINQNIESINAFFPDTAQKDLTTKIKPEEEGFFGKIQGYVDGAKNRIESFYRTLEKLSSNIYSILDHTKNIIVLLTLKILLQVIIFPLVTLWLMRKIFSFIFDNSLFNEQFFLLKQKN